MPRWFLVVFLLAFMMVKAAMIGGNFMHLRFEKAQPRRSWWRRDRGDLAHPVRLHHPRGGQRPREDGRDEARLRRARVASPSSCLLWLAAAPALAQCSMCQSVVAQSPEGQAMAGELNKAILLMFVAPYLVFGSFAA